jgi:hypothetical protein
MLTCVTPRRRPWLWTSWNDPVTDVASGELRESHTLELKRDDYLRTEGGRREMAKDLAALAVDGGTLIIGVEEDKATGRATALTPVAIQGLAERVDQIAAYRIDPPLPVEMRDDLRDPDDPTRGLVIVDVPASPLAPHMVDGRYYIRDSRTVRAMSDAEVVRHHQLRASDTDQVDNELTRAVNAVGAAVDHRQGRLVITAVPIPLRRPDALRAELSDGGANRWFEARQKGATARLETQLPSSVTVLLQRVTGWEWRLEGVRDETRVTNGIRYVHFSRGACTLAVEVAESGAVRVAAGSLVETDRRYTWQDSRLVLDYLRCLTVAVHTIALAAEIADHIGNRGTIGIGVVLDGVEGAWPELIPGPDVTNPMKLMSARDRLAQFRDPSYRQTTSATTVELAGDPTRVMDRLFGSLLRSLGLGDPLRGSDQPSTA